MGVWKRTKGTFTAVWMIPSESGVLAASLATVGMRVYAYRRLGGLTGRFLTATRELVETVVLLTLGILAQLKT